MKNDNKYVIIQVKKGRQSVILRTGWKGIDNMKKYQTFDEMFNDDEMVSPEDREQINLEVALIGNKGSKRSVAKGTCGNQWSQATSDCKDREYEIYAAA